MIIIDHRNSKVGFHGKRTYPCFGSSKDVARVSFVTHGTRRGPPFRESHSSLKGITPAAQGSRGFSDEAGRLSGAAGLRLAPAVIAVEAGAVAPGLCRQRRQGRIDHSPPTRALSR